MARKRLTQDDVKRMKMIREKSQKDEKEMVSQGRFVSLGHSPLSESKSKCMFGYVGRNIKFHQY